MRLMRHKFLRSPHELVDIGVWIVIGIPISLRTPSVSFHGTANLPELNLLRRDQNHKPSMKSNTYHP